MSKDTGKYFRFLSDWCPHLPITMATNMMQETPELQGISFDQWLAGANCLISADVVVNNIIVNSAVDFVLEVQTFYGGGPPKTHCLYHLVARMVCLRLDVQPLVEEFDLAR